VTRRRIPIPDRGPDGQELEIAVLDWGGDGPPALLHHANGFCAALWDGVARRLRGRVRPLALDARGHGDSSRPEGPGAYRWSAMADDLCAVARRLLLEVEADAFALGLGHSFGGTLTLAAAGREPGLFASAFLVDPVILPPPDADAARAGEGSRMAERARRRRQRWASRDEARDYLAERELFASWVPEELELYVAEALRERPEGGVELKCPGWVEAAIFEGDVGMDLFALAGRVEIPVRLLRAERGSFPRALYERLVAPMPRGEVAEAPAGHLMVMEEPERVALAVEGFLDDTAEAPLGSAAGGRG